MAHQIQFHGIFIHLFFTNYFFTFFSDSGLKVGSEFNSMASSVRSSVCCTPAVDKQHPNVKVECENGQIYYADHIICTIPLGVLKEKHKTLFSPGLPENKIKCMDGLIYGTVNKIYLHYEKPFLAPEISEIILLWENKCESVSDDQLPMSDKWYRKIYSFMKVTETLLQGWVSGDEAKYMETLKMEEVSETCTNILRQFLNDPSVPKPKHCVL